MTITPEAVLRLCMAVKVSRTAEYELKFDGHGDLTVDQLTALITLVRDEALDAAIAEVQEWSELDSEMYTGPHWTDRLEALKSKSTTQESV